MHRSNSSMPIASGSFLRTLIAPREGSEAARIGRFAAFVTDPFRYFGNFPPSALALCKIDFIPSTVSVPQSRLANTSFIFRR